MSVRRYILKRVKNEISHGRLEMSFDSATAPTGNNGTGMAYKGMFYTTGSGLTQLFVMLLNDDQRQRLRQFVVEA